MPELPTHNPVVRLAARVLLIDQRDRLLLFKWETRDVWITPGGGLLPGESYEQATRRELWEETGITGIELGPWVWMRHHLFYWEGQRYNVTERFFLVRTGEITVTTAGMDPTEAAESSEYRWWSAGEIQAAMGRETFAPYRLGELLPPLIAGEIPPLPIDTGP